MFEKSRIPWNKGKEMIMRKPIIKSGDKYNCLTAIKFDHKDKLSNQFWLFKCDCGVEKIICVNNVKCESTKSCGCLNKEMTTKRSFRHGMIGTRTYNSWQSMKQRCLNSKAKVYKNYGGRGIKICEEWLGDNGFINFYKDMGDRPKDKSLDRIKNDLGYYKSNCKYSTSKEQNNNKRDNIIK